MTGPEHYEHAEKLLTPTEHPSSDTFKVMVVPSPDVVAAAQVHALLALAAATALATPDVREPSFDDEAWFRAAGTKRRPA